MTRDEIISAISRLGRELGRAPSRAELMRATNVGWQSIYKHFGGIKRAVRAAGLEPGPKGGPLDEGALLLDWAGVVRKLGRLPTRAEYTRLGRHHSETLHGRFEWGQVGQKFVLMATDFHLKEEWQDVVEIVLGKFPLLRRSIHVLPQRTQRNAEEVKTEDPSLDDRPAWMKAMKLRLVPAALAIEILMSWSAGAQPREVNSPGGGGVQHDAAEVQQLTAAEEDQRAARKKELERMIFERSGMGVEHAQPRAPQPQHAKVGPAGDRWAVPHELSRGPEAGSHEKSRKQVAMYGEPLTHPAMANAPTNEGGVMVLFGALAVQLGFRIERIQTSFPDCEAKRQIVPGRWEKVVIEFEFESRSFKEHRHDPAGCDLIVCWKHNWPESPVEVMELRREIAGIAT